MFNYIRSDQIAKKPINKKPVTSQPPQTPMTPIEMQVNMPIGMQPIPQTEANLTCIYPLMNIPPNMPAQPIPVPPPMSPTPTQCMPCMHCMHYNMCMEAMPMPAVSPSYNTMHTPNPSSDMSKNQDDMEIAYIKKMYPPLCQKIQKYVESELDQYDHDLSPIYEMYPASETIDHMANCIYTDMKADMANLIKEFEGNNCSRAPIGGSFYTLIYAILLNELYRKRMRRRLYR